MTQEQAEIQRDSNNVILDAAAITAQDYKVLQTFTSQQISNWIIVMIPTTHNTKYNSATFEQLIAFARVYLAATETVGATETGYPAQYDIDAALDSVLGPYLGL